jgi:hypothetical protein
VRFFELNGRHFEPSNSDRQFQRRYSPDVV